MSATRGQRLALARRQRDLTQQQLAELSGIAQGVISAIENDKRPNLSATTLERLADVLGTTLDYLQKGIVSDGTILLPGSAETPITALPDCSTT